MLIRSLDILLSLLALCVLAPLLVPVICVLRVTGEGEIFYRQERIGLHGKKFKLIKFATMLKNSPNIGAGTLTIKDDPRVLPVGKFLRNSKINELPQLLNIVLGDMSIIGPRPMTEQTFSAYSPASQKLIKTVRPGLSGVGSIIFRGEEGLLGGMSDPLDFYDREIGPFKGRLEEWYVANRSLYLYVLSIFLTIWVVIFPNSRLAWVMFRGLPMPGMELQRLLGLSLDS